MVVFELDLGILDVENAILQRVEHAPVLPVFSYLSVHLGNLDLEGVQLVKQE